MEAVFAKYVVSMLLFGVFVAVELVCLCMVIRNADDVSCIKWMFLALFTAILARVVFR